MMELQQARSVLENQPHKVHRYPGMITTDAVFRKVNIKAPGQNITCFDGTTKCASNNTCCLNPPSNKRDLLLPISQSRLLR